MPELNRAISDIPDIFFDAGLLTLHDANENSGRDTCRCGSWRSDIRVPKMPLRSYVGLQNNLGRFNFSTVSSCVGLSQ